MDANTPLVVSVANYTRRRVQFNHGKAVSWMWNRFYDFSSPYFPSARRGQHSPGRSEQNYEINPITLGEEILWQINMAREQKLTASYVI